MKGVKDYLREGFDVKSSHADIHGSHWLVMQKGVTIVMVNLPVSMWTGKPDTGKGEECWEISA